MKLLSIIVACLALVCGLISARYWYVSSQLTHDPGWQFEPLLEEQKQMGWTVAFIKAR